MTGSTHKYNTRIKSGVLKRKKIDYDSNSCNNSGSDSDYKYESDSENNKEDYDSEIEKILIKNNNKNVNKLQYYRFLNKLFPSNYSKTKINKIKRQRLYDSPKNFEFNFKKVNGNKSSNESGNESGNESENESENESGSEYDEEIFQKTKEAIKNRIIDVLNKQKNKRNNRKNKLKNKGKNINIVLNMSGSNSTIYNKDDDDDKNILDDLINVANNKYNYDEDSHNSNSDNDSNDSDNENIKELKKKIKQKYNKIEDLLNVEKQNTIIDNNSNNNNNNSNSNSNNSNIDNINSINSINVNNNNICETSFSPVPKKLATKNYKEFSKILDDDDKEEHYFKNNLSKKDQLYYIIKLKQLKELTSIEKPYLIHLMNLDIPDEYKASALKKINILRSMGFSFGNSEYYKIKSWVDAFIKIPFNKYNNLPISFADGIEKCHDFMENAKNILDKVAFGLEDAKIQIMQMIGLWLVNPNAIGTAIAIKGPPGTGKTTLIKEGISKILNRPFAMIALGGCGDSGFLDGHDYTYEGSKYGKIIDILIQSGSMNPVILFDELDKLSDSARGQEITGVLTHLTDSTQNSRFSDKYMSEISLDMSKALYIFSYNDENLVNPILKDRMYKIETKGYNKKDKLIIAKNYLLPKIREQAKYEEGDIILNDDILEYIIKEFTNDESGVRNLKRCLEIIHTKLNLYRLMKPDINLFENSEGFKIKKRITFPCIINKENIDELLLKGKKEEIPFGMYN